jgi:hypothetical protein
MAYCLDTVATVRPTMFLSHLDANPRTHNILLRISIYTALRVPSRSVMF